MGCHSCTYAYNSSHISSVDLVELMSYMFLSHKIWRFPEMTIVGGSCKPIKHHNQAHSEKNMSLSIDMSQDRGFLKWGIPKSL